MGEKKKRGEWGRDPLYTEFLLVIFRVKNRKMDLNFGPNFFILLFVCYSRAIEHRMGIF